LVDNGAAHGAKHRRNVQDHVFGDECVTPDWRSIVTIVQPPTEALDLVDGAADRNAPAPIPPMITFAPSASR
jgi:hypothetical protein